MAESPGTSLIARIEPLSSWQQAADAIDRAAQLIADVPAFYGYTLAAETDLDLRAATVLVQRAVRYLHSAAAREAPRLEAIEARFRARDELPPWERNLRQVTEDGD
jgi:hypothetical protein